VVSKKNLLILLLFIALPIVVSAAPLQYLTKVIETETAFESVSTNWNAGDDDTIQISIGFNFPFNGATYNQVWINSNGMLSFSSSNTEYYNRQLPRTNESQSIYPYWDDLYRRDGGTIKYDTLGTGDNEHLVIHWKRVRHYSRSGRYTFQVILYKDGTIRFRYDSSSDADGTSYNGSDPGATIGVQEDTSHYDQHSYNNVIDQTKDIVYYPLPDIQISKSSCVIQDPVNNTTNPKRIPGATIRYAFQVSNTGAANADNVIVEDNLNTKFDHNTIKNLQIKNGSCDCLGVASTSNNGANGTANGVNPVKLDFGTVAAGSTGTPTVECGYFEVDIK